MDVRRPRCLELGLFLVVVAVPLAFTPFSDSPFADPKILLLVSGTLLVWLGGVPVDRRLAIAATAWVVVTAVACLAGVDPTAGLLASATGGGGGVVFTTCCAVLVVCGSGLPAALTARARGWLMWTGLAVSVAAARVPARPDVLERAIPGLSFVGATLGNQLFAGALVAAAMAAAAAGEGSTVRRLAVLVVMTAAVASIGERSSLVLPVVALSSRGGEPASPGAARPSPGWSSSRRSRSGSSPSHTCRERLHRRTRSSSCVAPPPTPDGSPSGASPPGPGSTGRSWGGGPAPRWPRTCTKARRRRYGRRPRLARCARPVPRDRRDDAGVVGLLALLALVGLVAVRAMRSPPEVAWAMGVAAALAAYSLVEPLNLVLTPLLFLTAGIAAGAARGRAGTARTPDRPGRVVGVLVTATLGVGLVLAALVFAAAILEQQGSQYGEPGQLRTALRLEPWRSTARRELAIQLAVAGRSGDAAAGREAQALMSDGVGARPWDPDARIAASRVDTLLNDRAGARAWLEQQLARFPGDPAPRLESSPTRPRREHGKPCGCA